MTEGLLLKNGWVIDPETEKTTKKDVLIIDGKFIQLESDKTSTVMELDVTGCYVAPGFIDMHVHVFETETTIGINPDLVGINQGVTTIVDAGSSGVNDFPTFKTKIIDQNQTEVLAFLNISRNGLCSGLSELANMKDLMTGDELQELLKTQTDIVGLKARMSYSVVKDNGVKPLEYARTLADLSQLPIMVHIGNAPPELIEILPLLQKEDIVTHAFHGKKGGILSNEGKLIDAAHDAIKRGVLFDVGHGTSSFSFQTMKTYKKNYPYPFTTSTDIYLGNYDKPVGSLMTTMSKLLALGYSLEELVASVTARPKKALRLSEQGCFTPGTRADVTIFKLIDKREILIDSQGEGMEVSKMLVPHITIRQGRIVYKAK